MQAIGYYNLDLGIGTIKKPIFQIREATKENFSPMLTNSALWENFQETIMQCYVEKFGTYVWLNIDKRDIVLS